MKAIAWIFGIVCLLIASVVVIQALPSFEVATYEAPIAAVASSTTPAIPKFEVTHIKTPSQVKAIYMTSYVAGTKSLRDNLVKLMDQTEVNAVVIDIKDYTGKISFEIPSEYLKKFDPFEKRIIDVQEFIGLLHSKGIYVIGRVSSFQDAHMVKIHPELAVKRASDGAVWKDYKGISWIDAGAEPMWQYLVTIGKESYALGFDEINFDYIRFPSDGNMKDIQFPFSEGKAKPAVLKSFYAYVDKNMGDIPISADLFGMTTTNSDDLGIGQILDDALQYFDFVAPMVYPSHYPKNFNGYANPNTKPYEVIQFAMQGGINKVHGLNNGIASSSPISIKKLRPWLQDFSILGVVYGAPEVRAQIKATYDVGLDSFMIWNASNRYTPGALLSPDKTFATSTIE
jgi:hypothetical protein